MSRAAAKARSRPSRKRAKATETRPRPSFVWEPQVALAALLLYSAIASWVALVAHRAPGYGVETDLLTDFAPAARVLLEGRLDASLYQFHGFGYPALLALVSLPVGGDFFLAARLLNLASAACVLWIAFLLFRHFGGPRWGLLVLLGLAVNPAFCTYTVEAGTDMPAFALALGATYGVLAGRKPRALAAAGVAAGLAYVTRYNAIAVLAASILVLLARRDGKRLACYAPAAAVPIAAWLVANAAMTGNPF